MNASCLAALLRRDPARFCAELAHTHGGIARFSIPGSRRFWVVGSPEALRTVLIDDAASYDKGGPFYGTIARALGDEGLFTTNNPVLWHRLRSAMNPSFRRSALPHVAEIAIPMWQQRVAGWSEHAPITLFEEAKQFNIELLTAYLFGVEADAERLAYLTSRVFAGMAGRIFLPEWVPGSGKYARVVAELMSEIDRLISNMRSYAVSGTLLGALRDATPDFTDKQLRDQMVTMLMAGHDSTACVFAWAMIRLSERPAEFQRLRSVVLGEPAMGCQETEAFWELTAWIRAAAHDHPAFPLFPRNVAKTTRLQGIVLSPGDQIIVAPYAVHHDPSIWRGFDDFLAQYRGPSRLTTEQRKAHLPFGQGSRKCIGEDLAMHIGVIMLRQMLLSFDGLRRPSDHSGERIRFAMTAPPQDDAAMWLLR